VINEIGSLFCVWHYLLAFGAVKISMLQSSTFEVGFLVANLNNFFKCPIHLNIFEEKILKNRKFVTQNHQISSYEIDFVYLLLYN